MNDVRRGSTWADSVASTGVLTTTSFLQRTGVGDQFQEVVRQGQGQLSNPGERSSMSTNNLSSLSTNNLNEEDPLNRSSDSSQVFLIFVTHII